MEEKVIETKTCKHCQNSFDITDKDREFLDKISPVFNGKKYLITNPTLCPECRQQRRLSRRNVRSLYRRKCDRTGESIISMYSPDKPYVVYDQKAWRSDDRDALSYGQEIDSSKSFFQQFDALLKKVPIISLKNVSNQNSDYINLGGYNKNCYLVFAGEYDEDCSYGERIMESKDCFDGLEMVKCTSCYENIHTENCYNLCYAQNCKDCSQSYFLYDCEGCSNCFLCVGLRNAQYCIRNHQLSKEDYEREKNILLSQNMQTLFQEFITMDQKYPHKNLEQVQAENCLGNYIFSCKNIFYGFDCTQAEDCRYLYAAFKVKNLMDVTNTTEQDVAYESLSVGYNSYSCLFVNGGWTSQNLLYCYDCHFSSSLFGCCGLRNKQYCILNKQYTKEEYERLVPQLIEKMRSEGERGEFFPSYVSPFGYNETLAMEYYPLTKEEALKQGSHRCDYEAPFPQVEKTLKADEIPDDIQKISDDILKSAIVCEASGKLFRITKPELQFYRKHGIPIPKRHPDQRHLDRMALRNPRKLWERNCDKCGVDIKTSYAPERPEIVYCENCYNKEVYG